jgi:hypothetical protein
MKTKFLIILSIICFQFSHSQDSVKMKCEYGFSNKEYNSLLLFQNIDIEKITFEGANLIGKFYEVAVKEYKKGKLIKRTVLLNTEVADYLKNSKSTISLKLFSKIDKSDMTLFVSEPRMYGNKMNFKLEKKQAENFILKSLESSEDQVEVPTNVEFPMFAIFTPYEKEDGTLAYCEVAQSKVETEQYWKEFKIPHYFIITMKFK